MSIFKFYSKLLTIYASFEFFEWIIAIFKHNKKIVLSEIGKSDEYDRILTAGNAFSKKITNDLPDFEWIMEIFFGKSDKSY